MTAVMSDADLIAAHVAGDPLAFSELVRRHRDRMWATALRTLGDPDDAADAVQDALISAFRCAGGFRGHAQVTTWLHRIVVNACLDRIRRNRARLTAPLPDGGPEEQASILDAVAARESRLAVDDALSSLPAEQRAAIVLVDVEGYSVAETAQVLGIAEGTVKSRCARGRARLAVLLGHIRNPDANANVSCDAVAARQHRGEGR
ncbi:MAG TPA: RNA polymerase sigma factor SigM [Pseudonocardiaceae bacterium]|nr:RNA polymerase sigma factor SigM [Pseudonocardiaceae bacterium]